MKPTLDETVGYQLVQAAKSHRQQISADLEDLDLHVGQELALIALSEADGLRQSEVADQLGVEPPTVTKTVRKLEKMGHVERREDPEDARAQQVSLTSQGEDLIEEIELVWTETEEPMLDGFTMEERLLLRRMLLKLQENLSEMNSAE